MANRSDIDNPQTWATFKAFILALWDQSAAAQGYQVAAGNSAAAAASSASSVAAGAARLFVDDATGLAATAEGSYYSIPSGLSDEVAIIKRKVSGAAVDTGKRTPDVGAIAALRTVLNGLLDSTGFNQSGYAWAVVDSLNQIALYVDSVGDAGLPGLPKLKSVITAIQSFFSEYAKESGVAWGVADANNRLPLYLDFDGNLISKGVNISNPGKTLACWGDSLTAGSGGTPYPTQLAALYGTTRSIFNMGLGGDTSAQIATRQGGKPPLVAVAGNQIPASGAVTVTPSVSTVLQNNQSLAGQLAGIAGILRNTAGVYNFTRTIAGSVLKVDAALYFDTAGGGFDAQTVVIWVGQNDTLDSLGSASVLATVAAMLASLKSAPHSRRFVVLSVPGANMGSIGSTGYNNLVAHNNTLRDTYPRNYIDARALLIRNYNSGIPQDVTDFNNDIIPSSLRSDAVHLNTAGYAIVATAVKSFLDSKGW